MNQTFKPNRQGITLLFVISMIVLFLLLGTAFVVVANNFNRESIRRIGSNVPEGKGQFQGNQLIDEAILQVIRGVDLRDVDSPLRAHDLLADQYGYGVRAFVSPSTFATGGTTGATVAPDFIGGEAFIQFALDSDPNADPGDAPDNMCFDLLKLDLMDELDPMDDIPLLQPLSPDGLNGTFGGRVLSFISGPAQGFSTRITADAFTPNGTLRFRIPATSITGDIITAIDLENLAGSEVIINGRDFSGGTSRIIDGDQQAKLINLVGQQHRELVFTSDMPLNPFAMSSGLLSESGYTNEPWDAADFANPFLSGFDRNGTLIPSFYRPRAFDSVRDLPSLFADNLGGLPFFHAFDEGDDRMPDVDTDNDGIADSFWMDLGMSIVTNSNGQRFKPLFAIHIRDMDGLLNVNAHGNITHTRPDGFVDGLQAWAGAQPNTPRGLGMGPPEINILEALDNDVGDAVIKLEQILAGRYGPDGLPGNGVNSFRSRAKLFGHPTDPVNPDTNQFGTTGGLYSTTMDIYGRFRIGTTASSNSGFDNFTDPNFNNFNNSLPQIDMLSSREFNAFLDDMGNPTFDDEFTGNPYEMSLSGDAPGDTPFTVEELERLLRPDDIDSLALPNRLSNIVDENTGLFTTLSFDVPTLYRSFPEEIDSNLQRLADLNLISGLTDAQRLSLINVQLNQQLAFAPELYFGLKMDLNRPFDDGIDSNNNQTTGEPAETTQANNVDALGVLGTADETEMDLDFGLDGNVNSGDSPRVIYARNLYMLAMLLLDPVSLDTGDVDNDERLVFARSMAQWAVNVVDFRDADSIHTRFVYDPNPFDAAGWNPVFDDIDNATGEVTTPAPFAVWGCERPELLISETLTVHIQNFQNLEPDPNEDPDWRQRLRPEPFAYFEVYNPWTQNRLTQRPPAELYDSNVTGVDLGKLAPDGNPVWRFEVERSMSNDPQLLNEGFKPLRYVYMADPTQDLRDPDNPQPSVNPIRYNDESSKNQVADDIAVFFGNTNVTVPPGRHALIGTRGFKEDPDADDDDEDTFEVFIGRKENEMDPNIGLTSPDPSRDDLLLNETTRLALNADTGTVTRYTNSDVPESTRQASIVFIDQASVVSPTGVADTRGPRKFSLTDPRDGYPEPETLIPDGGIYDNPSSTPLDRIDGEHINDLDLPAILPGGDGMTPSFRFIRLQRLANPLMPWNAVENPYLTIDTMEADLISFNGAAESVSGFPNNGLDPAPFMDARGGPAVSHERFGDQQTEIVGDNILIENSNNLWRHQRLQNPRSASGPSSDGHFFERIFTESLGRTNDTYINSPALFPWLTWNNRPFVSHMEIMNVPYLAPDRLTYSRQVNAHANDPTIRSEQAFSIDDGFLGNLYTGRRLFAGKLSGPYGHLINFFGSQENTPSRNDHSHAYRLLDFLEVPSRFVGNESWYLADGETGVLQHPFNTIPHYRVPGKINLNTIPPTSPGANASVVWDALAGEYRQTVTWENYKDSLYGGLPIGTNVTDFRNPFRPAAAANSVYGRFDHRPFPIDATLLRPRPLTNPNPMPDQINGRALFDYDSTNASDNTDRSFAFRNGFRTRLANMTTTKSSVFACWITAGFFEVDQAGNLVDTAGVPVDDDDDPATEPNRLRPKYPINGQAAEIGAESGEQVRHRGFFIFDRSIPVAYEPGKNHNIDKAILLKTIIE